MHKVNVWFANQISKLAGFHGDKSIIGDMKATELDVQRAAEKFGFKYFANETHFTLARARFC